MTNDPYEELPPAKRRWLIIRAALRSLLVTTVLVVLYYALPLDERWGGGRGAFADWLPDLRGIATWQVRASSARATRL